MFSDISLTTDVAVVVTFWLSSSDRSTSRYCVGLIVDTLVGIKEGIVTLCEIIVLGLCGSSIWEDGAVRGWDGVTVSFGAVAILSCSASTWAILLR